MQTDDKKFDAFFALVQETAKAQGKCFFMDSGEGHDGETDTMEMEDMSGWLVPLDQVENFQTGWLTGAVPDKFDCDFVFVKWSIGGGSVQICFD